MTRLQRRNKTRWIKLMKKLGYSWFNNNLWLKFRNRFLITMPTKED